MSQSGAKLAPARSSALNEAVLESAKPKVRATAQADTSIDAQITSNPFYNALFDDSLSVAEKTQSVAALMTTTLDSKQDRARAKEYDTFREWLSEKRTALAQEVIEISNVDAMAELQSVLKDMNNDLLAFNDQVNPIMDIIDSVYQLRTNGLTMDAFREIKEDQAREDERKAKQAALRAESDTVRRQIDEQNNVKANAAGKRAFFGLGGLTAAAQSEIAAADIAIASLETKNAKIKSDIAKLNQASDADSKLGDMKIHKDRLRELLDLSKGENREKMVALRDSASKFIATSKDRTGSLRGQFDGLAGQIHLVGDTNSHMTKAYAILNEGLKDARVKNIDMRKELDVEIDETDLVARLTRDEKLTTLDSHVDLLVRATGETMSTYGDLTQGSIRINTMRQSTEQQINTARQINTEGVAATADRLASVLTAVAGAGMNEASQASMDTLNAMRKSTQDITARESIRVASGVEQMNDQMDILFAELVDIRDVNRAATGIVRNGMMSLNENVQRIQAESEGARKDLQDFMASASLTGETQAQQPAAKKASSGFPGV
jgi:hypothetical protein